MQVQFVLVVFGLNLHALTGRADDECTSLVKRLDWFNPSTAKPPYKITTDVSHYTDGQVISVTLQSSVIGFRGFLLQARDEIGPVGTFLVMDDAAKLLNCGSERSAVTNSSDDEKFLVVVQWKAPVGNNSDIRFRATFVQNLSLIWVGVESQHVRYMATKSPNQQLRVRLADPTGSMPTETENLPNATGSLFSTPGSLLTSRDSLTGGFNSTATETASTPNSDNSTSNEMISTAITTDGPTLSTTPDSSSPSISHSSCLLLLLPLLLVL